MKIRVEHGAYDENELVLYCRELDDECLETLALLKERGLKLAATLDGETHLLKPGDVFYAEAVDGKTFIYTASDVLECAQSLTALHEKYSPMGLVRIGKSQIVNMNHVAKLKSLINSRIEITLKNKEKLIVSRRYIQHLKAQLGIYE